MRSRRLVAAALLAAMLGAYAPPSLAAPPSPPSAAAELKKKGDDAMDSLQYDEAIADYTKAYELSSDPALLYNRGRVYQARSQYPEALADIERFEREASPDLQKRVPQLASLLADLKSKVSTITVQCNVSGAHVLVRSQEIGTTPIDKPLQVNAGAATPIEVLAEGYEPYRKEVDLPGDTTTPIDATLVPKTKTGTLVVKTSQGPATIAIDGKILGNAPVEATLLAGQHAISVTSDKYKDVKTTAIVTLGQKREISIDLQSKPPIVAKWWFWTGVGVVLVGGVVVTYALLSEKSQPQGDQFSPSQVRGPLTTSF